MTTNCDYKEGNGKRSEFNIVKTDIKESLCWWCCHEYDSNNRKFIPSRYDDRKNLFYVYGSFCSWECAKAFNMNHNKTPSELHTIFTLMIKRVYHCYTKIYPAPHWQTLNIFGGNKTIEDFRENISHTESIGGNIDNIYNMKTNEYDSNPVINIHRNTVSSPTTSTAPTIPTLSNHKSKDTYVLKRKKPPRGQKNTLENTMGLKIV